MCVSVCLSVCLFPMHGQTPEQIRTKLGTRIPLDQGKDLRGVSMSACARACAHACVCMYVHACVRAQLRKWVCVCTR